MVFRSSFFRFFFLWFVGLGQVRVGWPQQKNGSFMGPVKECTIQPPGGLLAVCG